jgi:hypothetical protein
MISCVSTLLRPLRSAITCGCTTMSSSTLISITRVPRFGASSYDGLVNHGRVRRVYHSCRALHEYTHVECDPVTCTSHPYHMHVWSIVCSVHMTGWCTKVASDVGQTLAPVSMGQPMLNVTWCIHLATTPHTMSSPCPVDVSNSFVCNQCMHHGYICFYIQAEFSHATICYQCSIAYVQWSRPSLSI